MFLSFYMFESLRHSSCREHINRNSMASCANKLIFPIAATFFSKMGLGLIFFVGSGDSSSSVMARG